jgi:pimeloyl-ACP methyl ester carboxylesterase
MTHDSLGTLLRERIRRPLPLAEQIAGSVLFCPKDGSPWTLYMHHGEMSVHAGQPQKKITTRIFADQQTLADVIQGQDSGIEAFLNGKLTVRGNLALSMKLDSIFGAADRQPHVASAKYADAHGIRTFYLEAGVGEPVILLHGLGATNASMLPTLSALAKNYRVIAPDNPGFGESDKPVLAYHPAFFARWLSGFMDAIGISKAHLIGNSMGGRIALEMAMRHPNRTDKLVLLAPSMAWKRFRQFAPIVRFLMPELAFTPLVVPRGRVMRGLKLMFSKPERLQQGWYEAAVDEFIRVFAEPRGRVAFFSAAKQIYMEESHGDRGFWERLPSIQHEALFFWGKKDRLVPAKFAHYVERCLPHTHSITYDDCGHVPQFELADETHKHVRRFLEGKF